MALLLAIGIALLVVMHFRQDAQETQIVYIDAPAIDNTNSTVADNSTIPVIDETPTNSTTPADDQGTDTPANDTTPEPTPTEPTDPKEPTDPIEPEEPADEGPVEPQVIIASNVDG